MRLASIYSLDGGIYPGKEKREGQALLGASASSSLSNSGIGYFREVSPQTVLDQRGWPLTGPQLCAKRKHSEFLLGKVGVGGRERLRLASGF